VNTLYILQGSMVTGIVVVSLSEDPDLDTTNLSHTWLGHMSERGLHVLNKQSLLCGKKIGKLEFCEHCVFGKQYGVSFVTGIHRTKGTLDYIHSDVYGLSQVYRKVELVIF